MIYANRKSGAITGDVLLGPATDHIAHRLAWTIERGQAAARMLGPPCIIRTFEEGLKAPPIRRDHSVRDHKRSLTRRRDVDR